MYTDAPTVINNYLYGVNLSTLVQVGASLEDLVTQWIAISEQELNQAMGQTLEQETLTGVRMDGAGTWELALPHFPIQTLNSLSVNFGFSRLIYAFQNIRHTASRLLPPPYNVGDESNPALAQNVCDVFVDRDSGVMHVDLTGSLLSLASMPGTYPVWNVTYTSGQRNIIAGYTHGFPPGSLPVDIVAACGMLTAIHLGEMSVNRLTQGAVMVSSGAVKRQWANKKLGSLYDDWMKYVDKTIQYYTVKPLGN